MPNQVDKVPKSNKTLTIADHKTFIFPTVICNGFGRHKMLVCVILEGNNEERI